MAVTIKLKNASGSDPSASDLVVGEVAIRTDNGKLFTKKDNGSVAEITGGGGIDDGDKGDITVSNSGATFTIDNDAVTGAKIADDVALAGNPTTTTQSAGNDTTRIATTAFVTTADNLKMDLAGGSFVGDVTFAGTNHNILFDKSDSLFRLNDDAKIAVGTGTGNDMEIFHESSTNVNEIRAIDGEIHIQADNFMLISDDTAGRAIYLDNSSGHLELGFDGNHCININGSQTEFIKDVKFDGANAGRDIIFDRSDNALEFADNATAKFGSSDTLEIYHDGSNAYIDSPQNDILFIRNGTTGGKIKIQGNSGEDSIICNHNGSVELYEDNTKRLETTDTGVTVTGTLVATAFTGALTGNVTGNASGSSGSCTGNAATATALANARTISGESFDGTGNITLNNSNITNGAGYITATLTNEQVQDIVGGMVTGNTETGITVTYQDGDGTLDFVIGTLNQDTTGNAASADTIDIGEANANQNYYPVFTEVSGSAKTLNIDGGLNITYNPSSNTLTAGTFSGSGASLTSLNASNISSGTIAAARVATLNQNTTGSSASCTGNAATATALANARTISGASFDGTANITLNNANITNGAGYITSADGGNAATLDSIDSSQFLRSDAADTCSGDISFTGGGGAITLGGGSDITINNSDSVWTGNHTKIQHYGNYLYMIGGSSGFVFRESGANRWIIDGSGHFTPASDSTYNIGSNSTRVANGYFDTLYGDGSNLTGISGGLPTTGGELSGDLITHEVRPDGNNTRSLGTSSKRWSNVFTNDLHLSNKGGANKIDNSWGDYTIQEGSDDLFLINNRNGKMYKFMLKEVS